MRHSPAGMATALLCLASMPNAFGAEVAYTGSYLCDPMSTMNVPSFSVPATATRDGDRLTVSRVVYRPNTHEEVASSTGTAMIAGGKVAVDMTTPSGNLSARLTGTVTDKEIALSGTETVKPAAGGEHRRQCRTNLMRR